MGGMRGMWRGGLVCGGGSGLSEPGYSGGRWRGGVSAGGGIEDQGINDLSLYLRPFICLPATAGRCKLRCAPFHGECHASKVRGGVVFTREIRALSEDIRVNPRHQI